MFVCPQVTVRRGLGLYLSSYYLINSDRVQSDQQKDL